MGKGSTRRKEDIEKIWNNWDAIFKKDQQEDSKEQPQEEKSTSEAPKENAK